MPGILDTILASTKLFYPELTLTAAFCAVIVVDLLTLAPYDSDTVAASVAKTGRCVVVHEAVKTGGMGAEVIARLNEDCFWALRAPVARVTGWDVPYPLYAREKAFLPDADRIFTAIRSTLDAQ